MHNLILFKLWIFNIEFSTIISFICGFVVGIIIILLFYVLAIANSIRTKDFIIKTDKDDLNTIEVKQMIADTQTTYKDKSLRQDTGRVTYCEQLSKDLVFAIASRFYPNSKYPLLELSVNEITLLITYVTNRINELLNKRGLRIIRKLKISTVYALLQKKKQIEENKVYKTSVEIGGKFSKFKNLLYLINPINLGKNLIVNNVINIAIDKICLAVIGIVGEETYKIYSKKVFNEIVEIDSGNDVLIKDLEDSIKEVAKEIDSNPSEIKFISNKMLKTKHYRQDFNMSVYNTGFSEKEPLKKKNSEKEI